MQVASSKAKKLWIDVFFAYIAIATLVSGLVVTRVSRDWVIGDWLINYEGGFVRRGLPGQCALLLARMLRVSPVVVVACFYLALCAVFFLCVRNLALRSSKNLWILALIVSPATLSVQVLHPLAGFRKELIYLVALSVFVLALRKIEVSAMASISYLTVAVIISALSHEPTICYMPYYFAALVIGGRSVSQAGKEILIPVIAALGIGYVCARHTGDLQIATRICSSLGYQLKIQKPDDICSAGAIPYLARSADYARNETSTLAHRFHYIPKYPFFAALALLPAIGEMVVLWRARFKLEIAVLLVSCGFAFLGTLALFQYGSDWGRWIYIHVASIMVLLLFIDGKRIAYPVVLSYARQPMSGSRIFAARAFLVLYATSWILPNAVEPVRMGYIGRALYLTHYRSRTLAARGGATPEA